MHARAGRRACAQRAKRPCAADSASSYVTAALDSAVAIDVSAARTVAWAVNHSEYAESNAVDAVPRHDALSSVRCVVIAAVWQSTGLILALMLAGLRGVDQEIWKATRVDGIPLWRTYLFIVIPMMRPVVITAVVLLGVSVVRVYDLVVAQTGGGPGNATEVPAKFVVEHFTNRNNVSSIFQK